VTCRILKDRAAGGSCCDSKDPVARIYRGVKLMPLPSPLSGGCSGVRAPLESSRTSREGKWVMLKVRAVPSAMVAIMMHAIL